MIHFSLYALLTAFGFVCGLVGYRHGFRAGAEFTVQTFRQKLAEEQKRRSQDIDG